MLGELAALPWDSVGAGGIVVFAVYLVLTGRVVTRKVFEDMRDQRDVWQKAWKEQQQTIIDIGARVDAQTEAMRTMERVLTSITSRGR